MTIWKSKKEYYIVFPNRKTPFFKKKNPVKGGRLGKKSKIPGGFFFGGKLGNKKAFGPPFWPGGPLFFWD